MLCRLSAPLAVLALLCGLSAAPYTARTHHAIESVSDKLHPSGETLVHTHASPHSHQDTDHSEPEPAKGEERDEQIWTVDGSLAAGDRVRAQGRLAGYLGPGTRAEALVAADTLVAAPLRDTLPALLEQALANRGDYRASGISIARFDAERSAATLVTLNVRGYGYTEARAVDYLSQVADVVRRQPGIQPAGLAFSPPLFSGGLTDGMFLRGQDPSQATNVERNGVSLLNRCSKLGNAPSRVQFRQLVEVTIVRRGARTGLLSGRGLIAGALRPSAAWRVLPACLTADTIGHG